MSVYSSGVITQIGLALYAKVQAGAPMIFTRMQIGSGQLGSQDPVLRTALITPVAYFAINSIQPLGNTASLKGIFENSAISASTYICEVGLFATDPDVGEILYSYANAGTQGDTVPAISSGPYSKLIKISAAIGNASSVTANVPAESYVTVSDFDAKLNGTTGHKHTGTAGDGPKINSSGLAAGAATDTIIGNRTIDDSVTPDAGADSPMRLWSKLAYMIRRITGKANWYTVPATTLEAANTHMTATTGPIHGSTSAATAGAIMQRDVSGRTKVAAPTASDDVARKDTVDAAITASATAISDLQTKIRMGVLK